MPKPGRKQPEAGNVIRAAKRDSVRPIVPPADPARLLLARVLSALAGMLLGLFAAIMINVYFTTPWQEQLEEGATQISRSQTELEEIDPEFSRLQKQYWATQNEIAEARETRDAAIMRGAPAEELQLAQQRYDDAVRQGSELNTQFRSVESRRDSLNKNINFWRQVAPEAQRNIRLLNLLSFALIVITTLLGYLLYPLIMGALERSMATWASINIQGERRAPHLLIGFFGGLVLSLVVLLGLFSTFSDASSPLGNPVFRLFFGAIFTIAMGMAGALVGVNYFGPGPRRLDPYRAYRSPSTPKLLDTSVLIDGRIHDVAGTGFLGGALVVINSVLRELQNLADSSDGRKRAKGRRGLELVHEMQEDPRCDLRVFDDSELYEPGRPTDEQLIHVAHAMGAAVVTNDYNLNRVAAIRDVQVINLNALANAVKTRHVPGDMIEIEIIDRGKQRGQGVGYLDDGTMVVVEDGEPYIKQQRMVKLTSVTQTVQGRLIFGRVDLAEEELASDAQ